LLVQRRNTVGHHHESLKWGRGVNLDIAATRHDEIGTERIILADERWMRGSGGDEGGWRLMLLLEEGEERGWNYMVERVMQGIGGREWK